MGPCKQQTPLAVFPIASSLKPSTSGAATISRPITCQRWLWTPSKKFNTLIVGQESFPEEEGGEHTQRART